MKSLDTLRPFPCYSILKTAKLDCYPDEQSYHAMDTRAEVNLQDLLTHTAIRYLEDFCVH